ncbi:hypothetical protein C8R43DRAFT_1105758 [Mycena crocata]|nr:hypothetical protein C8R43DRAFT_1105758 [Mycena crocata]
MRDLTAPRKGGRNWCRQTNRTSDDRLSRGFVHSGGTSDPSTAEDAHGITRGGSLGDPTPMAPALLNSHQAVYTSITACAITWNSSTGLKPKQWPKYLYAPGNGSPKGLRGISRWPEGYMRDNLAMFKLAAA